MLCITFLYHDAADYDDRLVDESYSRQLPVCGWNVQHSGLYYPSFVGMMIGNSQDHVTIIGIYPINTHYRRCILGPLGVDD